jgi:hypothetical protein
MSFISLVTEEEMKEHPALPPTEKLSVLANDKSLFYRTTIYLYVTHT